MEYLRLGLSTTPVMSVPELATSLARMTPYPRDFLIEHLSYLAGRLGDREYLYSTHTGKLTEAGGFYVTMTLFDGVIDGMVDAEYARWQERERADA